MINKVVIGAPFGNWIQWQGATPTLGTFTRLYRGGLAYRLWRCLLTLRPHPRMRAWTNRLGLPNPGIQSLQHPEDSWKWLSCRGKIVSVSARCNADWIKVVGMATNCVPEAIELNVSCPNCGDADETNYADLFKEFRDTSIPLIIKLPPVNYREIAFMADENGIRHFHCCNTLPTPAGGLSGKPLQSLSLEAVRFIRSLSTNAFIIGGGGVTGIDDYQRFRDAGADSVSIASALLNPFRWRGLKRIIEHVAGGQPS